MLSKFLEEVIKYEHEGSVFKFKALSIQDMFELLYTEREFIFWLFEGVKTEDGKIIEDEKLFTEFIMNRYPKVINTVIALCYIQNEGENYSLKERYVAVDHMPVTMQIKVFEDITKKTFAKGVNTDVKKMKQSIQKIQKTFNLK